MGFPWLAILAFTFTSLGSDLFKKNVQKSCTSRLLHKKLARVSVTCFLVQVFFCTSVLHRTEFSSILHPHKFAQACMSLLQNLTSEPCATGPDLRVGAEVVGPSHSTNRGHGPLTKHFAFYFRLIDAHDSCMVAYIRNFRHSLLLHHLEQDQSRRGIR